MYKCLKPHTIKSILKQGLQNTKNAKEFSFGCVTIFRALEILMIKWEYLQIRSLKYRQKFDPENPKTGKEWDQNERHFNGLGEEGWELITSNNIIEISDEKKNTEIINYYFKRKLEK